MSALWIILASVLLFQMEQHEATFSGNNRMTSEQWETLKKQRYADMLLKESSGRRMKVNTERLQQREEDYVTQDEFDTAIDEINVQFNIITSHVDQVQSTLSIMIEDVREEFEYFRDQASTALNQHESRIATVEHATQPIGFTAYVTQVLDLWEYDIVLFNAVSTNLGGGYDPSTGKFTCSVTGLYLFSVTTFTTAAHSILALVKNDVALIAAFADMNDWDQGCMNWVVVCNAGEQVWVMVRHHHIILFPELYDNNIMLNAFSGVLIAGTE